LMHLVGYLYEEEQDLNPRPCSIFHPPSAFISWENRYGGTYFGFKSQSYSLKLFKHVCGLQDQM
jgi:hypothetical protein